MFACIFGSYVLLCLQLFWPVSKDNSILLAPLLSCRRWKKTCCVFAASASTRLCVHHPLVDVMTRIITAATMLAQANVEKLALSNSIFKTCGHKILKLCATPRLLIPHNMLRLIQRTGGGGAERGGSLVFLIWGPATTTRCKQLRAFPSFLSPRFCNALTHSHTHVHLHTWVGRTARYIFQRQKTAKLPCWRSVAGWKEVSQRFSRAGLSGR